MWVLIILEGKSSQMMFRYQNIRNSIKFILIEVGCLDPLLLFRSVKSCVVLNSLNSYYLVLLTEIPTLDLLSTLYI